VRRALDKQHIYAGYKTDYISCRLQYVFDIAKKKWRKTVTDNRKNCEKVAGMLGTEIG
jgi:hypothetical protein